MPDVSSAGSGAAPDSSRELREAGINFGTLGRAMTTLFHIATHEGWATIMYFQLLVYGCGGWGEGYETYVRNSARFVNREAVDADDGRLGCVHEEFPIFGRMFFAFYLFLAGFLLINLFVGVICDSMMQQQREVEEKATEEKAWLVATRLAHLDGDAADNSKQSPMATMGGAVMFEEEDGRATKFGSPLVNSEE